MEQHHQAAVAAAAAAWDQVRLHHGGPYPPIPMQQGYAFLIFLKTKYLSKTKDIEEIF